MAIIGTLYGTTTALQTFTSLGNNAGNNSTTVNVSAANAVDALVEVIWSTAATVTTAGTLEVWVKGSIDGTDFADDNGNGAQVAVFASNTANTAYKGVVSVASGYGGTLPPFFQIRVINRSGGTLSGTANTCATSYRLVQMQSV